jgi:hypothetical protein
MGDLQLLPATAPFDKQWPLGREFDVPAGHALRIRVTFGTAVNALCWVLFEV